MQLLIGTGDGKTARRLFIGIQKRAFALSEVEKLGFVSPNLCNLKGYKVIAKIASSMKLNCNEQ